MSDQEKSNILNTSQRDTTCQLAKIKKWLKPGVALLLAAIMLALVIVVPSQSAGLAAPGSQFTLVASPTWNIEIAPNQLVTYTITLRNTSTAGEVIAAGGVVTATFPSQMGFVSATPAYKTQAGNVVTWSTPQIAANTQVEFIVTARLASTQILQDRLTMLANAKYNIGATTYRPSQTNFHRVTGATITKQITTSVEATNNRLLDQAIAGEIVTVTIDYVIPQGTIAYDFSPRVVLLDGLLPFDSSPAWDSMHQGTVVQLRTYDPQTPIQGALVIFPSQDVTDTGAGPQTITFTIYAYRLKSFYTVTGDLTHNYSLFSRAGLRWCNSPGCTYNPSDTIYYKWDTTANPIVYAIQPEVSPVFGTTPVYLDAEGIGAGGGRVRIAINNTSTIGRPTAYNNVLTATLGTSLSFVSASHGGTSKVAAGVTYVNWDLPDVLPAGSSQMVYITATLPASFQIGAIYPLSAETGFETFEGVVPYEGKYSKTGAGQLRPGLSVTTKTSNPNTGAVTMGDVITYTVTFKQGANTQLVDPKYIDTLPLGFHYVPDSLTIQGATLTQVATQEGPVLGTGVNARYYENLNWEMSSINTGASAKTVSATYVAHNTGLDYRGAPVYDTTADLQSNKATVIGGTTGALLYWTAPSGSTYTNETIKANPPNNVGVTQPYMVTGFASTRDGSGPLEVGSLATLIARFRNTGGVPAIDANELTVCDTLPLGFQYQGEVSCFLSGTSTACPAHTSPTVGSSGNLCWQFPSLPRSTVTYDLKYYVQVQPEAIPGAQTSHVTIPGYTSQSGSVAGERDYSTIPAALPAPANCGADCLTVLGLAASKSASPGVVSPGSSIKYTIAYTDTSSAHNYTGLVITDTYDSLLTFVSANPAPTSHDAGQRMLVWKVGNVASNGSGKIDLTMQVASEIEQVYNLENRLNWDSNQTVPHEKVVNTPIDVADLHVRLETPSHVHAEQAIVFTVVYSNTGSATLPAKITLDYGPYLSFVSAIPAPDSGKDNEFTVSLPNGGVDQTLTINLIVNAPLPYTLSQISSDVIISSAGAPSRSDSQIISVDRPIFDFKKSGPISAPDVNGIISYDFSLMNTGNFTATNIVITDTFDTATEFYFGTNWTPSGDGAYAVYTIPSLAPGAPATINPIFVKVISMRDRFVNQAQLSSTQTTVQETTLSTWANSIALAKSVTPDPAFPGRVITYTLQYTNTGNAIANALVTDHLPDGFAYQGQSSTAAAGCGNGWTFNTSGQDATWNCSVLSKGASGYFQIWGLVTGDEGDYLVNTADSDGEDPTPLRTLDEPLSTRIARPWLRIDKEVVPTHPVAPGDPITYTLTYENYGTDPAYSVIIKDQLPRTQLTFTGCEPSCTHSNGLVTWNIGTVPTSTTGTVNLYATVKPGTHGQTIVNNAFTIQSQRLSVSETQSGPATSTTVLDPALTLMKIASPGIVNAPNDIIDYTLVYTNTGGGALHNVVLTDTLFTYTIFNSASASCSHTGDATGGTVTCELGTLLQGESDSVQIRVSVSTGLSSGDTITNMAQVDSTESPPASSNQVVVCYGVCAQPAISVPSSLSLTLLVDAQGTLPLSISNPGNAALTWNLSIPAIDTWLSASLTSGSTAGGGTTEVILTFDASGLSAGEYTTTITINSNAPEPDHIKEISVTLTVEEFKIYLPLLFR